jgi:hypothetical protein
VLLGAGIYNLEFTLAQNICLPCFGVNVPMALAAGGFSAQTNLTQKCTRV